MLTRYEALIGLLSLILGILSTLSAVIWHARGWVDRLNATDARLARAIEDLQQIITANQGRLIALEQQRYRRR